MRKHLILSLGVLVSVFSLLTIPNAWKTPLFFMFGVAIAVIEYRRIYPGRKRPIQRRVRTEIPDAVKIRVGSTAENAPETPQQN